MDTNGCAPPLESQGESYSQRSERRLESQELYLEPELLRADFLTSRSTAPLLGKRIERGIDTQSDPYQARLPLLHPEFAS